MFEGLYFEYPKAFSFIVIYIACEAYCKIRSSAIYFPRAKRFTQETETVSNLMWVLKWLSIVLLLFAAMSPVKDAQLTLAPEEGYDIALAVDASSSMRSTGFDEGAPQRSRFDAVKTIISDFVSKRSDDNLGLILFGDYAFIASPLTYDKGVLRALIANLQPGMAGKTTAIYEAVAQAVNVLKRSGAKNRVAVLLSDGYNTAGGRLSLAAAMALAEKERVKFYTIGVGAENGYDEGLLRFIAEESGGKHFRAANASALSAVYEEIDTLEKSTLERFDYTFKTYYYIYPLFMAFFTLLIYVYLRNRRGWL